MALCLSLTITGCFQLVFPLTWVDEGADIDAENLKKAKGLLVTPFIAVDVVTGILIGVGGLMMIGSVVWYLKSKCGRE